MLLHLHIFLRHFCPIFNVNGCNSFVKCKNILEFYNIATQKCWEERTRMNQNTPTLPPQLYIKNSCNPCNSSSTSTNNKSSSS